MPLTSRSALPGFHLALGYTLVYLSLIVLIPLAGVFFKAAELGLAEIWAILRSERVLGALTLSFGTALIAAALNAVFGTLVAWVFVRYDFPGKRLCDAMIDLPFALPTAVAGIALTALYAGNGWVGQWLEPLGIKIAFTPVGIIIALLFIGLPFVVRTVEPVLRDMEKELEEAAASLGANRWQTIRLVLLPSLLPSLLTGFALAFARGVGEYGLVIFKELRHWLRELHQETGVTTLFVTHDQEEALELADRVVIMSYGKIAQVGSVDDVYERPASPLVFDFLGSTNRISAQVQDGQLIVGGQQVARYNGDQTGNATIYVRPGDLRVAGAGDPGLEVTVLNVQRTGPIVRATVEIPPTGQHLAVEVPHLHHDVKQLVPRQTLRLRLMQFSVFAAEPELIKDEVLTPHLIGRERLRQA